MTIAADRHRMRPERPQFRRGIPWWMATAVAAVGLGAAGCGRDQPSAPATATRAAQSVDGDRENVSPDRSAAAENSAPAGSSDALTGDDQVMLSVAVASPHEAAFHGPLQAVMDKADVDSDDWQTEQWAAAAKAQEKRIAKWFAHAGTYPTATDQAEVATWAVRDVRCRPLRPRQTAVVFREHGVRVERAEQNKRGDVIEGLDAFVDELQRLCAPLLKNAAELEAHFKLYHVDWDPEQQRLTTDSYFELASMAETQRRQVNGVWHAVWSVGGSQPRLQDVEIRNWEEVINLADGGLYYSDIAPFVLRDEVSYPAQMARGVDHWRDRLVADFGVDPNGNQGLAVGDVNADGLDDVYVCQQGGLPNRLYVQQPDGTFRDRAASAGVDWLDMTRSALLIDLDNDGDQDLVLGQGWYAMVMENDGEGQFRQRVERPSDGHIYSMTAADYDRDGDLDLFFCGRNPRREQDAPEGILGTPVPYHDANNGGPNMLWRNDGQFQFTDVTQSCGLETNNRRYSYAASWADYDRDGDLDLYVANDFGRNNLYRNDGGQFVDVAQVVGVEDISAGMSATWGDPNRDGRPDVYVSNMFSSAGNRIAYQRRFREHAAAGEREFFQRHARGNSLFLNASESLGEATFVDASEQADVTMGRWAWGSTFVDLNNDGWEDLYVTNGFITTEDTGDL